ncbi:hypothetical protein [Mycolicibacterium sarraceniae]|uniref:hypothetical protein n=1 Tax=Mycolicibacterium sarraceniae TaxID=1534348 RepID=UPI0013D3FA8F|nr:hypothetical protein [Mycolicibacterium sarraceniae]
MSSSGTSSAPDIISQLQSPGYEVQLNGQLSGGLSQCTVTGVHQSMPTAYVDPDCTSND